MAVLVEGISVVIQRDKIDDSYRGGWSAFVADCPNGTLCADAHLARVGFMDPRDSAIFCRQLEANGLSSRPPAFLDPDFVVVDQVAGPMIKCEWLDLGAVQIDGAQVQAARFRGDRENRLATPDGWTYERSLSRSFGYSNLTINADGLIQEEFISQGLTGQPLLSGRAYPEKRSRWRRLLRGLGLLGR